MPPGEIDGPVSMVLGQGKVIDSQLDRAFENWARAQGTQRVFLGVIEANPRAHAFWVGFKRVERRQSWDETVTQQRSVVRRWVELPKQAYLFRDSVL